MGSRAHEVGKRVMPPNEFSGGVSQGAVSRNVEHSAETMQIASDWKVITQKDEFSG